MAPYCNRISVYLFFKFLLYSQPFDINLSPLFSWLKKWTYPRSEKALHWSMILDSKRSEALANKYGSFPKQLQMLKGEQCSPRKMLETVNASKAWKQWFHKTATKLIWVVMNMNIFFLENWQFSHKLAPHLLHTYRAWKSVLTIWQNMKSRGLQKSQFPDSLVNWEKSGSTS